MDMAERWMSMILLPRGRTATLEASYSCGSVCDVSHPSISPRVSALMLSASFHSPPNDIQFKVVKVMPTSYLLIDQSKAISDDFKVFFLWKLSI